MNRHLSRSLHDTFIMAVLVAVLAFGALWARAVLQTPDELATYINREPASVVIDNTLADLCIAGATPTARAFLGALRARYGSAAIEDASREKALLDARLQRLREAAETTGGTGR